MACILWQDFFGESNLHNLPVWQNCGPHTNRSVKKNTPLEAAGGMMTFGRHLMLGFRSPRKAQICVSITHTCHDQEGTGQRWRHPQLDFVDARGQLCVRPPPTPAAAWPGTGTGGCLAQAASGFKHAQVPCSWRLEGFFSLSFASSKSAVGLGRAGFFPARVEFDSPLSSLESNRVWLVRGSKF